MNTIHLTPKELDAIAEEIIINYSQTVASHMPCICKKKQHKNCPKHQFQITSTVVFASRQSIGDKVLHQQQIKEQNKIIVVPG